MVLEFNHKLIAKRGGNLCGEDLFSIESCAQCQGQYLFNRALKDVYYDPEDLSRHFFKVPGIDLPPCRYCGAMGWQFSLVVPDQLMAQTGPWAWSLKRRSFTFGQDS